MDETYVESGVDVKVQVLKTVKRSSGEDQVSYEIIGLVESPYHKDGKLSALSLTHAQERETYHSMEELQEALVERVGRLPDEVNIDSLRIQNSKTVVVPGDMSEDEVSELEEAVMESLG